MTHKRIRILSVALLGVAFAGDAIAPRIANAAMLDDGYCADSCLSILDCNGNPGASCTVEECWDNMNKRHDYVIRCNMS